MDILALSILLVLGLTLGGGTVAFGWWAFQKYARKRRSGSAGNGGTEGPGTHPAPSQSWGAEPQAEAVEQEDWIAGPGVRPAMGTSGGLVGRRPIDEGAGSAGALMSAGRDAGESELSGGAGYLGEEMGFPSVEHKSSESVVGLLDEGLEGYELGVEAQELAGRLEILRKERDARSQSQESLVRRAVLEPSSPGTRRAGETPGSAGRSSQEGDGSAGGGVWPWKGKRSSSGSSGARTPGSGGRTPLIGRMLPDGGKRTPASGKRTPAGGRWTPGGRRKRGAGKRPRGERRVRFLERWGPVGEGSRPEKRVHFGEKTGQSTRRSRLAMQPPRGALKRSRSRRTGGDGGPGGDGSLASPDSQLQPPVPSPDHIDELWPPSSLPVDEGFIEDEDVKAMLRGSYLQKIKSSSWMKSRFYKLQEDVRTVWYDSQKILKSARNQIFSIDDIQEVRPGHQSEGMQRYAMEIPTDRCFTIIFKGRRKNLDLVASDAKEALHWIDGLNKLKKRDSTMNKQERLEQWFQIHLQKADMNKDNKMTLNEVKRFMQMMNIHVDDMYAKELFMKSDKSKDGSLSGKEIEDFYKLVTEREEVTTIFNTYSNKDHLMSMEKLSEFLRKEQRENATQEYAAKLIKSYEVNVEARDDLFMTKDGFLFFLMSPEADIFHPEHNQVYQDMTKPLNQYYISSSHNTYLTKDQVEGPSSVEAYISALNRGCRCLELDCWDGKNGEPVIYHGYTLTSKILFKDVIQTINDYAFKVSQFPLILSLENHCDVEQQNVMAQHLKTILGNKLLTRTVDGKVPTHFPSPEQLKGKILIKGKRLNRLEDDQSGSVDEVSDEDEAAEMEGDEEEMEKEKGKKVKLSKELSDLVIYCRSVHFNGFEDAVANQVFYEMSSFVENKFNKLVQDTGTPFIQLNARQLSRIYPAGLRTDSSNYSPIDMWNVGCQIVALNFQTPGEEMDIYQAKFRDNGFAGYNLKPKFLREKKPTFDPKNLQKGAWLDRRKLHVMIISAQQLPKSNMAKPSSAVDPLVTVEVFGVKEDNSQKVTDHINNNGFNPMWNTSFQFDVSVPELAVVRFLLQDYDISSRNDFIGQFSLPFTSMQLGYRHIHLLSMSGDQLPSASLFVHIMIE